MLKCNMKKKLNFFIHSYAKNATIKVTKHTGNEIF